MNLLIRAAIFAANKHRDQRRKDAAASPYINHPLALADVLANEGGVDDVEVLCAALLHDTIEVNHPGNRGGCLVKVKQVPQRVLQVDDSTFLRPLPAGCRRSIPVSVDG